MNKEGAELAGEMSGHIFFADGYYGYDDAIFASCRLIQILSHSEKTVSQLLSDLPKTYTTPEIRIDCPDNEKFAIVRQLTEEFKTQYEVIDIDGARVVFEGGWGLLRASNTQPILVLRFEAFTPEGLVEIKSLFCDKLNRFPQLQGGISF